VAIAALACAALGCARSGTGSSSNQPRGSAQPEAQRTNTPERREPVAIEMRNVRLHPAAGVVLDVAKLRGRLVPTKGSLPVFDDQQSFYIDVDGAALSLDAASVTALVNHVFAYEGSPLSDLEVEFPERRIEQRGKLRKGIPIPFTVEADVVASDGDVRLHPVKVRAAGLPSTKVMDLFGIELDDLIRVRAGRGIRIRDNDLYLTPSRMLTAPEVRGRVSAARVEDGRLWLNLGSADRIGASDAKGARAEGNFIWFRGGRIRFGRLTMHDADLRLIDADPGDAFDFNAALYNEQLVAGYSRNTPSGALRTYMPDHDDLSRPAGRLKMPSIKTNAIR
jgi:hypothetical protein